MYCARTYWLLQEIYQRVCSNYYANGEFMKERLSVWLDRQIPTELRHTETKDGHFAYFSLSQLEQGISCTC
jgi:hypothetical protein